MAKANFIVKIITKNSGSIMNTIEASNSNEASKIALKMLPKGIDYNEIVNITTKAL